MIGVRAVYRSVPVSEGVLTANPSVAFAVGVGGVQCTSTGSVLPSRGPDGPARCGATTPTGCWRRWPAGARSGGASPYPRRPGNSDHRGFGFRRRTSRRPLQRSQSRGRSSAFSRASSAMLSNHPGRAGFSPCSRQPRVQGARRQTSKQFNRFADGRDQRFSRLAGNFPVFGGWRVPEG